MQKQEVKVKYNDSEVFFFAHGFKTPWEYADDFIKRNKGKFEMKLYFLNNSSFGEQWILNKVVGIDN